jgi:hypothetical protein
MTEVEGWGVVGVDIIINIESMKRSPHWGSDLASQNAIGKWEQKEDWK